MIVNQWVPAAHRGDAIGDSARRVRGLLRAMGHQSDIFALTIDDDLVDDVRPFADPAARRGDLTIFHFALPSPMTEAFARLPRGADPPVPQRHAGALLRALRCRHLPAAALGRAGAGDAGRPHRHGARRLGIQPPELEALGFDNTGVFPIAVDVGRITAAPRRPALERVLDDGPLNFLFVGRIVPNKKIEDHIRLAEHYKRYVDVDYRFIFVGRTDGVPRYYNMIRALVAEYQMPADRFVFTGPVPDDDLATYYRTASVYISLSEHEGFCVPLLEAMAADVPVLAYGVDGRARHPGRRRRAVRAEGSRGARPSCSASSPTTTALRAQVIAGQRRRLADFGDARIQRDLTALLAGAVLLRPVEGRHGVHREDCFHRPALRRRDPRRIRVSLPADRRAAGRPARGRGADHVRPRLRHLAERVSRRASTGSRA